MLCALALKNCLAHNFGDEKLIKVEESVGKIEAKVVKVKTKLDKLPESIRDEVIYFSEEVVTPFR